VLGEIGIGSEAERERYQRRCGAIRSTPRSTGSPCTGRPGRP